MNVELNVYDMFHTNTLRDRETAIELINRISKIPQSSTVTLNFDKIIFASRSFCHELIMNLQDKRNINFVNMNSDILNMMNIALRKPSFAMKSPMKVAMIH